MSDLLSLYKQQLQQQNGKQGVAIDVNRQWSPLQKPDAPTGPLQLPPGTENDDALTKAVAFLKGAITGSAEPGQTWSGAGSILGAALPFGTKWLNPKGVAQGFDQAMYHATRSPGFEAFETALPGKDFGIHMTPSVSTAENVYWGKAQDYTNKVRDAVSGIIAPSKVNSFLTEINDGAAKKYSIPSNPRAVMPLQVDIKNPFDIPDLGNWTTSDRLLHPQVIDDITLQGYASGKEHQLAGDELLQGAQDQFNLMKNFKTALGKEYPTRDAYGLYPEEFYHKEQQMRDILNKQWQAGVPQVLGKNGFDSMRYKNVIEGRGEPSFMLFDPSKIRLPWANFDPAKKGSSNLLDSIALPATGVGTLLANRDKNKK